MSERAAGAAQAVDRSVFASIPEAIEDIRAGKIVLVVDDADRENEGDFIMAAEDATPEAVNFMVTHGRGIVCLPVRGVAPRRAAASRRWSPRPPTVTRRRSRVSIDYRHGTTTGTSAQDRAAHGPRGGRSRRPRRRATSRSPATSSRSARRRAASCAAPATPRPRSIWREMAGLFPAGVICEVMNEDGTMARLPELIAVAQEHGLKLISIADLIEYRRHRGGARGAAWPRPTIPTPVRRVPLLRVREPRGRPHARGARDGRGRRRREGPHARALGVPDRRRLRVPALRLRVAARPRASR